MLEEGTHQWRYWLGAVHFFKKLHKDISRPAERQQEARGKVVIQRPPNLQVIAYPPKRVSFGITARPLRYFEEFLRIRPLQSEAPRSTRPWAICPLCPPPPFLSAGLDISHMYLEHRHEKSASAKVMYCTWPVS